MRLISATKMIPYVDRVFRFEEAKEAFAHLEKQAHVGKVVIKITAN